MVEDCDNADQLGQRHYHHVNQYITLWSFHSSHLPWPSTHSSASNAISPNLPSFSQSSFASQLLFSFSILSFVILLCDEISCSLSKQTHLCLSHCVHYYSMMSSIISYLHGHRRLLSFFLYLFLYSTLINFLWERGFRARICLEPIWFCYLSSLWLQLWWNVMALGSDFVEPQGAEATSAQIHLYLSVIDPLIIMVSRWPIQMV